MNAECALVWGSWCSSLHLYREVVKEVFVREGSFEERRYKGIQGSLKSNIGANCTSASQDMSKAKVAEEDPAQVWDPRIVNGDWRIQPANFPASQPYANAECPAINSLIPRSAKG